jgi:hypothetical protein
MKAQMEKEIAQLKLDIELATKILQDYIAPSHLVLLLSRIFSLVSVIIEPSTGVQ